MIDWAKALRDYLKIQGDLQSLVSSRIYAEADSPPPGYKPDTGPAICFKARGGQVHVTDAMLNVSVQFKVYGQNEVLAHECYRRLYDCLHGAQASVIRHALCETLGVMLYEAQQPSGSWPFVLTFFSVVVANE